VAEIGSGRNLPNTIGLREFDGSGSLDSADEMRQALDQDGIFVVRNALSPADVAELRSILLRNLPKGGQRFMLGRGQFNASVKVPELAFIFSHQRILKVIKQVLGEDNVVFTGHCDIHMNMLSGWHKDSGENVPGGYFSGPYMTSDDCRVYKVAVYLQDTAPGDSFTARLGSHRETDLTVGPEVDVLSRTGDIVVFDVRITHVGQLPNPIEKGLVGVSRLINRGSRERQDPAWVSRIKETYWKLTGRRDRLAVFFTYGADNTFTYDFAEANMNRQERVGSAHDSTESLPPALSAALANEGVALSPALKSRDSRAAITAERKRELPSAGQQG
jgi:hypothetical protein